MKKPKIGFTQALTYILDLYCYSYYVKNDPFITDIAFDQLEKLYTKLTGKASAPNRGIENSHAYSYGVKFIYDYLKKGGK